VGIIAILCILMSMIGSPSLSSSSKVAILNHPQPGIWEYQNQKNQPSQALVVTLEEVQWQAQAAACLAPAFYDRLQSTPLMFDSQSEEREITIPHETKSVLEFGDDVISTTQAIALTYWTRAEIIVATQTYEEVLWSVPIASFLSAPILVNPDAQIMNSLHTKCAIVIGESELDMEEKIELKTKEDVWSFQLELFDMKGQECDYIIITNPYDTVSDDNIKWRCLSLASSILAAKRLALVQTGYYTGSREKIDTIAKATKEMGETYEEIKPYFEKVKSDTHIAAQFLSDHDHNPEFLALVGGSYALPDYYFDYHISYFYWGAKVDYVASSASYGNLTLNLSYESYPCEDLGVGRIIGHSLLDSTLQLTRTFFYREFLPGGIYENLTPHSWEEKSAVIEGHRLNQPQRDGPPATNDIPYIPAGDVDLLLSEAGFNETYYLPRNFTQSDDMNIPIGEVFDRALNSSVVLINAHGGVPGEQALLEIGLDSMIEKEYLFILDKSETEKRSLPPSVVYLIGCETGTTAIDLPMEDYLALGFIHSGSVAYIAPDTYQTICFWDKAPEGPEADQTVMFFEKLLNENIPIGRALSQAKWEAQIRWRNETSYEDDVAGTTLHLYGDPAFIPSKPNVPFEEKKQFDIKADYNGQLDAGSSFSISVTVTELGSNQSTGTPDVTIEFHGKTTEGTKANLEAPDDKGVYEITVSISKEGYSDTQAVYRVYVQNSTPDLVPILSLIVGIAVVVAVVGIYMKKRR
jgi:hypothetical protein